MINSVVPVTSVIAIATPHSFRHSSTSAEAQENTPYGTWVVQALKGRSAIDTVKAILELKTDGAVTGTGGGNHLHGTFEFTKDVIRFNGVTITKIECSPSIKDQENRLLAALEAATTWKQEDNKLFLFDNDGEVVAFFLSISAPTALTNSFPALLKIDRKKLTYNHDSISVEYISAGSPSLSALSTAENFVVAAKVIAASGARYAGERLIWWTKSKSAAEPSQKENPLAKQ